nr:hypothetical protein [Tanacetum cinerariifolium]
MIAILEKSEHNVDFHQIVDFVKASHISLSFLGRTVPLFATMLVAQGEGSGTPTEPHHTPSPQASQSPHHDPSLPSHPTASTKTIPTETPTEIPTLRQYFRRATRTAQSKALPTTTDEPASLLRDDSQGEAFLTVSGIDAGQDRENIIKTSALPHEPTPRVTSLDAYKGTQDLEISSLKAMIKLLEDKDKRSAELSGDDAPIKERSMEIGEEAEVEKSIKLGSNDTKELVNVLTSMEAVNILTSEVAVVSVPPVAGVSTVGVPTVSGFVTTVSAIFTTTSVKKKLQEQIDAQVAKEIEEEIARDNQRMNEQIVRDAEIAKIHAEEELKMLIDGLDRGNEVIARHLQEYEESEAELTTREKIELINELMKYQDHHAKILKYQAQQSKPLYKKEQRDFYMSVLRSHAGWKTRHFKGMKLKEIKEKFIPQLWALVKETLSIRHALSDKDMKLWVDLKRLFEPDFEDQLWTHTQALMHDPLEWKLYDTCGVHHVFTKDQEIFMLVERDYPLRR